MRNTDRLADAFRGRVTDAGREARTRVGAGVIRGLGAVRRAGAAHRRAEVAVIVGAGLAMLGAGAGTASAATVTTAAHTAPVSGHVAHAAAQPSRDTTTAAAKPAAAAATQAAQPQSWSQIEQKVASQTSPSEPRAADQLQPVGTAGAQEWMPIGSAQQANANTIVQQALAKKMGLRSAVIAVATAMQESELQNISYGTSQSLGLFQQQTDMGWGDAQQIMNPTYSSDAFLSALQQYQASNPGWAQQPLWQTAQGVQKSGFPLAYAKWETQAAQIVQHAVSQQV
jgi:hypothetical protein